MILSKGEMSRLDVGRRTTYKVTAHERSVLRRDKMQVRHKMIEDFAVRYTNHLERYGVVSRDISHISTLCRILKESVQ